VYHTVNNKIRRRIKETEFPDTIFPDDKQTAREIIKLCV